jgi:hypothetical protein
MHVLITPAFGVSLARDSDSVEVDLLGFVESLASKETVDDDRIQQIP